MERCERSSGEYTEACALMLEIAVDRLMSSFGGCDICWGLA